MRKDAQKQFEAKQAIFAKKNEIVSNRKRQHRSDNRLAILVGAVAVSLAFGSQVLYYSLGPGAPTPSETPSASPTNSPSETAEAPAPEIAEGRVWSGTLNLNEAPISVSIDGEKAPQAAANFISLTKSGFYEGLTCHRLTTSGIFVLQCGDPKGDGTGGPEYRFGPIENAPEGDLYPAGTIAMARQSNLGDSMGSQFFIVYEDSVIPSDVAGGYSVFGTVTEGLDAILAIAKAGTAAGSESPVTEVKMTSLSVE